MKHFSDRQTVKRPSNPSIWLALGAAVLLATGCGKKTTTAAPPTAPVAVESPTPATPTSKPGPIPLALPVAVAASPEGGADLKQLNHAYIGWIVQSHQRPKTFEEFIAKSGLKFPPAPAGKKYAFSKNGFIALVDQ